MTDKKQDNITTCIILTFLSINTSVINFVLQHDLNFVNAQDPC